MNKFFKIIFHLSNILVIIFYLFPGSIFGWLFYEDINIQPQLTKDFFNISSNHFYTFFVLSFFGIISYKKNKNLKFLVYYFLILSIILELLHLIIPERSFQFSDLFGNILGVLTLILFFKIWKNKNK
tara:strand:+ start:72 stop:452 length:381 start_codon:yes stop_codon:yes gene_type:complete